MITFQTFLKALLHSFLRDTNSTISEIRLLPKIKQKFPKQSLRHKLIFTINETFNKLLEMTKTLSQFVFINFI